MSLRLQRIGVVSVLALIAVAARPTVAHAEPDTFGVGDGHSGAKTVIGDEEINSYAGLTADAPAGTATLTISALAVPTAPLVAAPFAAGDLVLVWRSTGVAASAAPSGADTTLNLATAPSTPNNASGLVGRYEFARVLNAAAGSLTLTKPLVHSYARLVSQVVRVPEFTTVTVPAATSILATAWQEIGGTPAAPNLQNPWAGGIVIFLATGAITNNGTIHANARGFHGGIPVQRTLNRVGILCDNAAVDGDPTGPFAPKGQGVVHERYVATSGAKGNVSMAGGGGNCVEAGGGGGANRGNGGNGSGSALNLGTGGEGGAAIDVDVLTHLTMGGGGGAGRHISSLTESQASLGGFGGGVVYVRGQSLGGTGVVQANGGNGENSGLGGLPPNVTSEGSGGGGAGGTIVIRLTGTLDCDELGTPGGRGGDAQVLGLPALGAGGGGGGGRVFFQAQSKTAGCDVVVTPGAPGNGGPGGAAPGQPGGTQPPPTGGGPLCIPTTNTTPGTCADPTPVCDTINGNCQPCTGPFGGGSARACPVQVEPVCLTTGACAECNGDFGTAATQACQLAGNPTCFAAGAPGNPQGSCGKCTTNADCTGPGTHAGPVCNPNTGACGNTCTTDQDCKPTEWCAPAGGGVNVCTPKTPNGDPVPPVPPIDGECTPAKGQRVCLSAVCEEVDDKCGKQNGSGCGTAPECRSQICHTDNRCGLPDGQPCTNDPQCRSELCQGGVCTGKGCGSDPDCPPPQVCEPNSQKCVDGCRPGAQPLPDAGPSPGLCPPTFTCVAPDGGPIGNCVPGTGGADGGLDGGNDGGPTGDGGGADAGDIGGIIEGGGCSCSSTFTSATSPLTILGAAASVLALLRRRKQRTSRDRG